MSKMCANVHLWHQFATDAVPGNEVSNRKSFIITVNYFSNLDRHLYPFLKKIYRGDFKTTVLEQVMNSCLEYNPYKTAHYM